MEGLDLLTQDVVPATADVSGEMEWREEIHRALSRLTAEQREAFLLHHVEGLSYEEMAELTGAGPSALKMRVSRAADRLRAELEGVFRA
jgi:RNA polymerase sigma-70 factor (ECF subfamily)